MKRVEDLWGKYTSSSILKWRLCDGDLFIMQGDTQEKWHHAIPVENNIKSPRFNINFRKILTYDSSILQKGKDTYYRYCVAGDSEFPEEYKYSDIIRINTITNYFNKK